MFPDSFLKVWMDDAARGFPAAAPTDTLPAPLTAGSVGAEGWRCMRTQSTLLRTRCRIDALRKLRAAPVRIG